MLKSYIITLYNTILAFSTLTIFIIILFLISSLLLIFMVIVGILDVTYRPDSPQYPFNILLDILCPIIFLISPIIFLWSLEKESLTLYDSGIIFIILHIFFTIPLIHIWSKNRNWPTLETTWKNPKIFLHIAIGILYPMLFLILANILRYLRFNKILDLSAIYEDKILYIPVILCILFCWETFYIWLLIFSYFLQKIIKILQTESLLFLKSFHIYFLRYKIYFFVSENIYKIAFIIISFLIYHPLIYTKEPRSKIRILIHKLYLNFWLFYISAICFIFFEFLFFEGNINYSLSFTIIILIIKNTLDGISFFSRSSWTYHCCLADFISHNWEYPRYPLNFWRYFPEFYNKYDNSKLTTEFENIIKGKQKTIQTNFKARLKFQQSLFTKNYKRSYMFNVKTAYMRWSNVRWTHTEPVLHKATGFFVKTFWEKIALINSPRGWANGFEKIQQIEKKKSPTLTQAERECYVNYKSIPLNAKKFGDIIEHNFITNFETLKDKYKVEILSFNKKINVDIKSQPEPDAILDFRGSNTLKFKKILGIDQKAYSNPRESHCKVFSDISSQKYQDLLTFFEQELLSNVINLSPNLALNITKTLTEMKTNVDDFVILQEVWAKNLHVFPENYIPPLRVPNNFSLANLKPEALEAIKKAHIRLKLISDTLYAKKIPETCNYEEALELFQDSQIQEIFKNS